MDNSIRSFMQWSNLGYKIKKGARALPSSTYGRQMFDATQVEKVVPPKLDNQQGVTAKALQQVRDFDFTRQPQPR